VAGAHHVVVEPHPHRRHDRAARPHVDLVVVLRRRAVFAVRFDHGQREAFDFHLAVAPAGRSEQIGAAHFEPDQVVGVVDDTHGVGFRVADAYAGGRSTIGHRDAIDAAAVAAAFSARVARSASGLWKIAEPATIMLAPAATTRATLWMSMPPSISTRAEGLPTRSSSARTSATFDSLRAIKVWPPNPGLTDMTST